MSTFKVVTPHREGCKGKWEPTTTETVRLTCDAPWGAEPFPCPAEATADLPALLAENAGLEASRTEWVEAFWKLANERDRLAALATELAEIDPERLRLLADWFDKTDASRGHASSEVQTDLRKWAAILDRCRDEHWSRDLLDTDTAGGQ